LSNRQSDFLDNTDVASHLVIGESQHEKSVRCEPLRAARIVPLPSRLKVLRSVHFDDDPCPKANEVDKIVGRRELPPEAQAVDLFSSQPGPQHEFEFRMPVAKIAGAPSASPGARFVARDLVE
jgi:hypothetical protein